MLTSIATFLLSMLNHALSGFSEQLLRHLNQALGSSLIARHAYHGGQLRTCISSIVHISKQYNPANLLFTRTTSIEHYSPWKHLHHRTAYWSQLSWRRFRREPATSWFDWSFAPMPRFDERFARQYRYEPPSLIKRTSPYPGIVHQLSGPNRCAPAHSCII